MGNKYKGGCEVCLVGGREGFGERSCESRSWNKNGDLHMNRAGEKEPGAEETALGKAQKCEMHDPLREHGGI